MSLYALVGRRGAYTQRWHPKRARDMYAEGVRLSLQGDLLQVWRALDGDLLGYDSERTRKLTDKVVAARTTIRDASPLPFINRDPARGGE